VRYDGVIRARHAIIKSKQQMRRFSGSKLQLLSQTTEIQNVAVTDSMEYECLGPITDNSPALDDSGRL